MLELAKEPDKDLYVQLNISVYGGNKNTHSQLNKGLIVLFPFMQRLKNLRIDF